MASKFKCAGSNRKPPVCDYEAEDRWLGRCPSCGRAYNVVASGPSGEERSRTSLAALALKPVEKVSTGVPEFDRVLGGGLPRGGVVLLSGEAGAGKSTLLIQAADGVARDGRSVLYASGEQKREEVGAIAARLGALNERVDVMGNESDVYKIVSAAEEKKPALLVVDSINTAFVDDVEADVNSSRQIEACGNYLVSFAKSENVSLILVCHQAKDGSIRAPQVLVHLVDTVVYFDPYRGEEGDDERVVRDLRSVESGKNRYGASNVEELLEMTESGLKTPPAKKLAKLARPPKLVVV